MFGLSPSLSPSDCFSISFLALRYYISKRTKPEKRPRIFHAYFAYSGSLFFYLESRRRYGTPPHQRGPFFPSVILLCPILPTYLHIHPRPASRSDAAAWPFEACLALPCLVISKFCFYTSVLCPCFFIVTSLLEALFFRSVYSLFYNLFLPTQSHTYTPSYMYIYLSRGDTPDLGTSSTDCYELHPFVPLVYSNYGNVRDMIVHSVSGPRRTARGSL